MLVEKPARLPPEETETASERKFARCCQRGLPQTRRTPCEGMAVSRSAACLANQSRKLARYEPRGCKDKLLSLEKEEPAPIAHIGSDKGMCATVSSRALSMLERPRLIRHSHTALSDPRFSDQISRTNGPVRHGSHELFDWWRVPCVGDDTTHAVIAHSAKVARCLFKQRSSYQCVSECPQDAMQRASDRF
jgi:hypothetical protein